MSGFKGNEIHQSGFIFPIESIRSIAAFYVAAGHTLTLTISINYGEKIQNQPTIKDFIIRLVAALFNGQTAVIIFFMISGLVIGKSLAMKNDMSIRNYLAFLLQRIFRIYPAHLFSILVIIILAQLFIIGQSAVTPPWSYPPILAVLNGTVFTTANWHDILNNLLLKKWDFNPVTWSIHVEMIAALFLPLLHYLSRKNNLYFDLVIIAILSAITLHQQWYYSVGFLFVFYLGLIIETQGKRLATFFTRQLAGTDRAIIFFYLLMMFPAAITVNRPPFVILTEGICGFILLSLITWGKKEKVVSILNNRQLRYQGCLSYSFYLWHYIILLLIIRTVCKTIPLHLWNQFEFLIFIGVLFSSCSLAWLAAYFSYNTIEKPFIRWGKYLVHRLRQSQIFIRSFKSTKYS